MKPGDNNLLARRSPRVCVCSVNARTVTWCTAALWPCGASLRREFARDPPSLDYRGQLSGPAKLRREL